MDSKPPVTQPPRRKKERPRAKKRPCEACGEPFEPNPRGGPRRFCVKCAAYGPVSKRWRAAHKVEPEPRACIQCGEAFVPERVTGHLCSDECRWRWKYELAKLRKAA